MVPHICVREVAVLLYNSDQSPLDAFWQDVAVEISRSSERQFTAARIHRVAAGCINNGYRLTGEQGLTGEQCSYFVKTNNGTTLDRFVCEADGLVALASPGVIGVPRPVCHGSSNTRAFLVTEYIESGEVTVSGQELLGERLAALHQISRPQFGWDRDNFIGPTPQPNPWSSDWVEFLRIRRIGYQLALAANNGYTGRLQSRGELLLAGLDGFFNHYQPQSSLLHGDLWNGNYTVDTQGNPFIFDPAVYYGDRESDIAMTELFGGFSPAFYGAYNNVAPLDSGYPVRKRLYQLYHILNHANLFGDSYVAQAESIVDSLLAEL